MEEVVDFGFREVRAEEKSRLVRGVFDSVATRYDIMNDLMSVGIHRAWKAEFVAWLAPRPDMHLLDVAGGTGDIAFRFLEKGGGRVTVRSKARINHTMSRYCAFRPAITAWCRRSATLTLHRPARF